MCAPPQALKNFGFHSNNMKSESSIHKKNFWFDSRLRNIQKMANFPSFFRFSQRSLSRMFGKFSFLPRRDPQRGGNIYPLSLLSASLTHPMQRMESWLYDLWPLLPMYNRGEPPTAVCIRATTMSISRRPIFMKIYCSFIANCWIFFQLLLVIWTLKWKIKFSWASWFSGDPWNNEVNKHDRRITWKVRYDECEKERIFSTTFHFSPGERSIVEEEKEALCQAQVISD